MTFVLLISWWTMHKNCYHGQNELLEFTVFLLCDEICHEQVAGLVIFHMIQFDTWKSEKFHSQRLPRMIEI